MDSAWWVVVWPRHWHQAETSCSFPATEEPSVPTDVCVADRYKDSRSRKIVCDTIGVCMDHTQNTNPRSGLVPSGRALLQDLRHSLRSASQSIVPSCSATLPPGCPSFR